MTVVEPDVDPRPDVGPLPAAAAAWSDGTVGEAGSLTGYRLFSGPAADSVPDPSGPRRPVIQVHVAAAVAEGHTTLVDELARRHILASTVRLDGLGVAAHLLDEDGRRSWVGPRLGRRLVPAGGPGTATPTVGLVLGFRGAVDLRRAWALLDQLGDELYDQQVLDRSAHLPAGVGPPPHTTAVSELHVLGDDGSRLVHLHTGAAGRGTAWVACRPGRFELGHWIHHEEVPA